MELIVETEQKQMRRDVFLTYWSFEIQRGALPLTHACIFIVHAGRCVCVCVCVCMYTHMRCPLAFRLVERKAFCSLISALEAF